MIFSQRCEPMKPPAPIMHIVKGFIGFPSRSTLADDAIVSLSLSLPFSVCKILWKEYGVWKMLTCARGVNVTEEKERERFSWLGRGK